MAGGPEPRDPLRLQKKPTPRQQRVGRTLQRGRQPPQGREGLPMSPSPALTTVGEEQEKKLHAPVVLGGVDVPGGEDIQGQDVGVNERLICFWGVTDPTCKRSMGTPLR